MKKIIIAIHGLGNKPAPAVLEDWWLKSIQEGLTSIDKRRVKIPFRLVYWADVLHQVPLDHKSTDPEDPLFVVDPYRPGSPEVVEKKPHLKTKLLKYLDEQLDKIVLNEDLRDYLAGVTDRFIHRYFADLETYYSDHCVSVSDPQCSANQNIKQRLLKVLRQYQKYDIFLIAHSMGSIVAFDVLSEYSDQLKIHTFATIGSPLGISVIMGRKFAEQKLTQPDLTRPVAPDCIWPSWYNFADPEDSVAMDHTLHDDYAPNRQGTSAVDITVYNNYEINGESNPHKSYGYLRTPEFARIIDQFLSRDKARRLLRHYHRLTRNVITESRKFLRRYLKRH